MAKIINGKYRVKNSKNEYDIIYLETSASQVKFDDGKTFQEKLNSGELKGDKGDKGATGATGAKGADGLTTSVTVGSTKYTHTNGNITLPAYPTLSSLGASPASHGNHLAYATCSTDATTAEKVVTVDDSNWKLTVGNVVMIKFTVSNTASSVKLNVNGTGAYPIWYNNAEYTSTGTAYTGYANRVIAYMFNGTHWVWLTSGYDSNTTYTNAGLGQGYVTCSTGATTVAKVGTLSSYSLTTGGIVSVKFTNAVPASATLNINSKGAKAIYFRGSAIKANIIKAGDIATFIYNGSQYHLISIDRWQNDIDASIKSLSVSGTTITYTKGDGTTGTITTQDTNTVYTHPSTHPASIITQDANNRFVTDTEKANWNAKANANNPVFTGTSFSYNRKENTTVGSNSAVIGNSEASGDQAIVIGDSSKATGQQAISIGTSNHSTGLQSIALGTGVNSTGKYSTAMGKSTNATNEYSLSTGCWTTSDGIASSTFGNASYTNGWGAFSSGIVTKAHGLGQHVFGAYNVPDDNVCGVVGSSDYKYSAKSKHLMIVGNGTSSALSNAYTLDWNGNGWYQGNVSINGTPSEDNHVITKKYADEHYAGGSQDKIIEITKSLKVTTEWIDTGISGADLETGTYAVQMLVNDGTNTRQYSEFYSGMMSWYGSTCNSQDSDEIPLHKAGHSPNGRHTYLRTLRGSGHTYLKLQISTTDEFLAESSITFKFRKLI